MASQSLSQVRAQICSCLTLATSGANLCNDVLPHTAAASSSVCPDSICSCVAVSRGCDKNAVSTAARAYVSRLPSGSLGVLNEAEHETQVGGPKVSEYPGPTLLISNRSTVVSGLKDMTGLSPQRE